MASPAERLAEQHRVQQVALRAQMSRDVVAVLRDLFDTSDADRTWPAIRAMLAGQVRQQHATSAQLADAYYLQARAEAGAGTPLIPVAPTALVQELLQVVLDSTGIAAFKRAIAAGRTPEEALQIAGVTLSGSTSRLVLNGGRDSILRNIRGDRQAVGWARLTDRDPCAFCAMLASRGPVYRSRETARFAAHDHCACMPVPAWNREEAWLQHSRDLYEQWQQATDGFSGEAARRAWRRYWDSRKEG